MSRYTITTALPYANGPLHIGHLAGVYIPADVYARFLRRNDHDVILIGGSDEHGIPITIRAKKEGVTPQDVVDRYHELMKQTFTELGISYDNYSRTTAPIHIKTAQEFFLKLYEDGKFIEEETEQYFDEKANEFLADRYIVGTCPKCGNTNAYGDQCEKCGSTLSPDELINPHSMLSGEKPILKKTKHWYLPLNEYQEFISDWILKGHKKDWKPNVYGQVKSWLEEGLKPRAMTRDLDWGVPVPLEGEKGKVLYVWFDAPIGYISSTKEWAERTGKDWKPYWQDKETKLVHFIAKDNIVFHCIIFPAMLKAHGDYILPDNVPANEFLNLENDKISTSRNWAVWAHEYLADFPGKQDSLRYTLIANAPETKDNNFTWKDFQTKNNSELVGIFGNFINRVSVLINKYYDGEIPEVGNNFHSEELEYLSKISKEISTYLSNYEFRNGLSSLMNLARLGNKFLQEQEPWKKIKDEPEKVKETLYVSAQIAAYLGELSEPFIPFSSQKIMNGLNLTYHSWKDLKSSKILLPSGSKINLIPLLFDKIEDKQIDYQIEKLENSKKQNASLNNNRAEPQKDNITFDEFEKIDLRIGTILEAKKVEKADKLLQFKIDTGIDVRNIVSGISESFTPEELVGKQVTVLVNLAPRKIRGIESQGMLLLSKNIDGKFSFITPDDAIENGVSVK
ncbi:methionine--tRNA ligase [Apibacter sp. B3889]|uniref:methionine--tRNA ligase n=1 Tax=unclassified Apibacter TaxID=2630820 RepID=UPI00132B6415|nr:MULTISPECIES: methionine--tRNA ligase [unclassified Apibacter]MXO33650.1 methionine--tRNA ligase [Apibacter sp. B3883]MXO41007.1 methionine--tRNA ligase [Apibacter sp. B3889]MXP04176.1 methionine--tRNA ligase [Apibacter sp. B3887]MXP07013.1 methionine--tRNA ligase [Apibacter sp. B3935]